MSTGIMTGTAGLRRPEVQERTPGRTRRTGTAGTGGRRRHLVPPRTGSRQQVTVRGRRVAVRENQGSVVVKLVIALVLLVGLGVATTMFLSARTTDQAFALQDANDRSTTLGNELESLNRDYRELSSSDHLASEASRLGMVVPGQAGVLDVRGDQVNEVRPADATKDNTVEDLDATGTAVPRADRPTSDPAAVAAAPATTPDAVGRTTGSAAPDAAGAAAPDAGQGDASAGRGAASQTGQLPYAARGAVDAG